MSEERRWFEQAPPEPKAGPRTADPDVVKQLWTKCPECDAPFYDFDGCCALTRDARGANFCGSCMEGGKQWDSQIAHAHDEASVGTWLRS